MDDPKNIIGIITITIAVILYLVTQIKNENKRPKNYIGYICPRCQQGFEKNELRPVWQFPTAPLRLLGWNKENQFNLGYCNKCKKIVNVYLVLSFVISIPVMMILVYSALLFLGIVKG